MFGFDLELLLAGFANPVVFAVNERVVVDAFAVVVRAQIALHHEQDSSRFHFCSSFCADSPRIATPTRRYDRMGTELNRLDENGVHDDFLLVYLFNQDHWLRHDLCISQCNQILQ